MFPYKNVVFDMGMVLTDYDADAATRQFTDDPEIIREVNLIVYHSSEWFMMDAGLISEEEALDHFLNRCSSDKVREIARLSFENWDRYNLFLHPGMDSIIRELKQRGHGLYVLSNISSRLRTSIRQHIPEPELFDGIFMSAEHQCLKPQPLIYELFCREYQLDPKQCFFVDDLKRNIEGANACGIDGCVFDGDTEHLRSILELEKHDGRKRI